MQRYFTILKNNFNGIYIMQLILRYQLMIIAQISQSEDLNVITFAKTLENKALENERERKN
jgi:hypothetical protein